MLRSLRFALFVLVALLVVTPVSAQVAARPSASTGDAPTSAAPAKSVEALIQEALAARKAKKNADAIRLLQQAIGVMQKESQGDLASFLPPAVKGWTSNDPKPTSGTWTVDGESFQWMQVQRIYEEEGTGARVELTITSWPQLIQGQRAAMQMFKNPQMLEMMNRDPNKQVTVFEQKPWAGWTMIEKGESAQTIALSEALMVMMETRGDAKPADLERYWKLMNLAGLGKLDRSVNGAKNK